MKGGAAGPDPLGGGRGRGRVDSRSARFLLVALALVGLLGCGAATRPPDVVVVVVDTLRPDHLGFYGYERETAPFLAELAARSLVFDDAVSTSSWTAPSTASLFTGLNAPTHGVVQGFFAHRRHVAAIEAEGATRLALNRMPDGLATLPELFARAGYRCFGVATNPNIGPEIGFARGFHAFRRLDPRESPDERWTPAQATAEQALEVVLGWREEMRGEAPFFLYVHLNDPHAEYNRRAPWYVDAGSRLQKLVSAYDSEISYTDRVVGRLYDELDLGDESVIVVLSDHGEAFGEHGALTHNFATGLYREVNRVLFMLHAPQIEPGRTRAPVSLVDVLPTLLALAELPEPEGRDGWSLAPLIGEDAQDFERVLGTRFRFAHRAYVGDGVERAHWAAMRGRWKLIQSGRRRELYDMVADPGERRNRADEAGASRGALETALDAFRLRPGAAREVGPVELDARDLDRLRALGYAE